MNHLIKRAAPWLLFLCPMIDKVDFIPISIVITKQSFKDPYEKL